MIFTLCAHAQQAGYAFGCVSSCVYVCVYNIYGQKIRADLLSALPFEKILLCVLYYLIVEFKHL